MGLVKIVANGEFAVEAAAWLEALSLVEYFLCDQRILAFLIKFVQLRQQRLEYFILIWRQERWESLAGFHLDVGLRVYYLGLFLTAVVGYLLFAGHLRQFVVFAVVLELRRHVLVL